MRAVLVLAAALVLGGCDLRFGEPRWLWLAWLTPLLGAFFAWSIARRRRLTERLVGAALAPSLAVGASTGRAWLKAGLVLASVLAMTLAVAEPRYGFTWEEVERRGADLVIALDVSDSMLATDGAGPEALTRLERAKRKIDDLVGMLDGDRVALVAFAGAAFVECPLTLDYAAMSAFVSDMETDVVSAKGTSLAEAIRVSLRAFAGGSAESRAILLISDGEDTTGEARAAAEDAAEKGVRIYAVGIGSPEGVPIPGPDGSFRREPNGELVLSRLNERALQDVATVTNGAYVRSVTGDVDLEAIYRRGIQAALAERDLGSRRKQRWHERYQWLVALALLTLSLEALLPDRVRRGHA